MNITIEIERASSRMYRVTHKGVEIGVWKDPECSAARYLVDNSLASRDDTLLTCRGKDVCLRGPLSWFADNATSEPDRGRARFVRWTPYPNGRPLGTA